MLPIEAFEEFKIKDFIIEYEAVTYVYNNFACITTKKELLNAIDEVYFWQYCKDNCFSSMLMSLIAKADNINQAKLHKAFPDEVCAYLLWFYKEAGDFKFVDDDDFFKGMKNLLESEK